MPDRLTTNAGAPIVDNQNSVTAGPRGPVLLQDYQLIEKLAHQNRERIPERIVHAKGWGAFGTLTVTHDITKYTRAKIFSAVGKETPCLFRFSTVAGELGAADAERDVRGFAMKYYTEEGNWDLVGNNTPVFFVRDPLKFPDFTHTQKRHPRTNLRSTTAMWDFWSLSPESLHQVTILMSDRGLPPSPRFMNGYGSHTYSFWNDIGERYWIKFHFKTQQGTLIRLTLRMVREYTRPWQQQGNRRKRRFQQTESDSQVAFQIGFGELQFSRRCRFCVRWIGHPRCWMPGLQPRRCF